MSIEDKDFAALALRAAIGPMLIAHGYNKIFGSGGLEGTTGWFRALGLEPAAVHARMAAGTEISAGTLIILGAANPLPSAAVVGLMATAAATDHRGKGFFVFKGGWEYTAIVGAAATALAGLGYGRWSLDRALGRNPRSGPFMALGAAALGLASAAGLLAATYRPQRDEPTPESAESQSAESQSAESQSAGDSKAKTPEPDDADS